MVVPCFNEASRWDSAYWTHITALPSIDWAFIDDGSTDATPGKLANFVSIQCEVGITDSLLVLPTNVGKGEAVRAG